jgi:hypothetical protein
MEGGGWRITMLLEMFGDFCIVMQNILRIRSIVLIFILCFSSLPQCTVGNDAQIEIDHILCRRNFLNEFVSVLFVTGLGVHSAVITNSYIVWSMAPWGQVKVCERFRRTYRLRLQGLRVSQSRYEQTRKVSANFSLLDPWRWRHYAPPTYLLTFIEAYDVIS